MTNPALCFLERLPTHSSSSWRYQHHQSSQWCLEFRWYGAGHEWPTSSLPNSNKCQKSKVLNEDNTGTFGIIQGEIIIQKDHTFSSSTRESLVFNNVNTKHSSTIAKAIILSLTSPKFPTMLLNFQPPTKHVHWPN